MPQYVDKNILRLALQQLQGTAGTLFRIWLTLKHMGLEPGTEIPITTANSNDSLIRLFGCGHPEGKLFTPFVSIPSDRFMSSEAGRSIIQTTVRQWLDGSGVYSPIEFLAVRQGEADGRAQPLIVSTKRMYPQGLGRGKEGFAHVADKRVSIPKLALAIWYGRQTQIPEGADAANYLLSALRTELHLSPAEEGCVFVDKALYVTLGSRPLNDSKIFEVVQSLDANGYSSVEFEELESTYLTRIRSMQTTTQSPSWLTNCPEETLKSLIAMGAKAILLYGPPRTGKTRAIDLHIPRTDSNRKTIQIHDGWGYEQLIQGYRPQKDQTFKYEFGSLALALAEGKTVIVLEEINRTLITQSLGEVFSLIEDGYRGEKNKVSLRDNSEFFIAENVVFFMTMNTVDKSTEEVDDALIGRVYCVEFPPRVEDLAKMLTAQGASSDVIDKLCKIFAMIQGSYPLGHGYFAKFTKNSDPLLFYKTKIRPVLQNHLQHHKLLELAAIDNYVDELFAST